MTNIGVLVLFSFIAMTVSLEPQQLKKFIDSPGQTLFQRTKRGYGYYTSCADDKKECQWDTECCCRHCLLAGDKENPGKRLCTCGADGTPCKADPECCPGKGGVRWCKTTASKTNGKCKVK